MADCIFCKIVSGEAEAIRVFEDQHTLAFADIFPLQPGHTLVIPKTHVENIYGLDPQTAGRLFQTAAKVAAALKKALGADGMTVHQANERAGGQDVFHVHIHVIPRRAGVRVFSIVAPRAKARKEDLEAIAAPVREELAGSGPVTAAR